MNLIFRLIWMLISARFGSRRALMDEGRLAYRCWPTDLDMNIHMTNSRYHSFMDLSRVELMVRNGAWARIRKAGLYPVLGSSSIRFRRPIRPLKKFEVTARVLSWDDRWIYIAHKLIIKGGPKGDEVAAVCVVKTTFLSEQGRVPTDQLMVIMGYDGPKPDAGDLMAKKDALDAMLTA